MDIEIKREFDRLNKKLNQLAATKKETWVSPGWITDITGWNNEKLRQAREQKLIEFKRSNGGGWLYKLESIPERLIIKKQAS
jgi:hypothetical protein